MSHTAEQMKQIAGRMVSDVGKGERGSGLVFL